MDSEQIEDLVRRAQQGDVRAFEQLIAAHIAQVRRFARAFARSHEAADDLAQDALVKVYRSLGGYRFQSAFSTWLYAIVRNVYLDGARSRAGKDRAAEQPLDALSADGGLAGDADADADTQRPDRLIEREEERRTVWSALSAVPPEFRATLVLYDIEGFSYEEIAAIEKAPLGTVKSRLSRGREHLRRVLLGPDGAAAAAEVARPGNSGGAGLVTPKRTEPA
jgi:RNA polymerase sigma-70 factor (ECF subfamily)